MSKFRTTEMGGRENLHFFQGFSFSAIGSRAVFRTVIGGKVCGCGE